MKLSRKAKRYDDTVLPGDFVGFEPFSDGDALSEGEVSGALRRTGDGVELGHITLERLAAKKQTFAKLKSRAEVLTRQLTYLDEHLEIVDHDRRGMYIQLRSLPPYKDDSQIRFNEISIGRDKVVVKRIAFYRRDEVKQQVAFSLTEDLLERLMSDLRQVLSPV
ncbi:hypothetical protein [Geothrix sp. 21YS21S-2]|uniref:hypothetical protein n=1 Tax=Geothrix sp. 21YS21S-2 TaxID=3068893 RepID=UPI0027B97012|nr:hypothetical protein [Geothrix sp. 21YS21S-2]